MFSRNLDYNEYAQCNLEQRPLERLPLIWGPNEIRERFTHAIIWQSIYPMPESLDRWLFEQYCCHPVGAEPFTWERHMMVKSNKIN
jgi:hypothetical protein